MNYKNIKFFFFLFIGIFLFKWVYDFFGSSESIKLIEDNKSRLYLIVLIHIPTLFFDSLAWRVFIKKGNLSLFWSFIITWISQASGRFFPTGTVTGEFIRIYLGTKKGLTFYESSSTVFADLVIATFSLFIMASLSTLILISDNAAFLDNEKSVYVFISLIIIFFGCLFFYYFVKKRIIKVFLKKNYFFNLKPKKETIKFLIKLDLSLYKLSMRKTDVVKATFIRLLGWISGAVEIYVFLSIIGIEVSLVDVILIESFTGIIRSIAFFIPAGLGIQELAFILIGNYVGLGDSISFSMAIGRRIREVAVGLPAVFTWFILFRKTKKKGSKL